MGTRFDFGLDGKFFLPFFFILIVNSVYSQSCNSYYGPTGAPPGGLNLIFCDTLQSHVIDATPGNFVSNVDAFIWSTGDTTPIITINNTGLYTMSITSQGSQIACEITFNVIVGNSTEMTVPNDTQFCANESADLIATSLYPNDTITWTGYPIGQDSINVNATGQYEVVVSDTNGCQLVDTVNVTVNPLPTVNLGSDLMYCQGNTFGIINNVGAGFSSYLWHDGVTNQFNNINQTDDTVWVEVTDVNGCVNSDTLYVLQLDTPTFFLGNDTSICANQSTVLTLPLNTAIYNWSVANAADTLLVNAGGVYSATITDNNGCQGSDEIVVTIDTLPVPNLGPDVTKCVEDSVVLNAGLGYLQYNWSNNGTTATQAIGGTGNFMVTVVDSNGCVGQNAINVFNDTVPVVDLGVDDSICVGQSFTMDAGTGFNSYSWSTGGISQTEVVTQTGQYWVEITNGNGCVGSDTFELTTLNLPVASIIGNPFICQGDTATLYVGNNALTYNWSTGHAADTIYLSTTGVYNLTVTDQNNCQNFDSVALVVNTNPTPVLPADIEYCMGTTFSQSVDAGVGYLQYSWMDGSSSQIRSATQNDGVIWVEVMDVNGCKGSDTMLVNQLALPFVNIGSDDSICADLSYALSATSPTGVNLSYLWNNGSTSPTVFIPSVPSLNTNQVNVYSVTVTDMNGCMNSDTMQLTQLALPNPILPNDTSYCKGDAFSIALNPGSFVGYNWSTGAVTPVINIGAIAGNYTVTVTDVFGCENSDDITVVEHLLPNPNLGPDDQYCSGSYYSKSLFPGVFSSYEWSSGEVSSAIVVVSDGTYSVTVEDGNGCANSDTFMLTEVALPIVDLGEDVIICETEEVDLLLESSVLLSSYAYLWSTGSFDESISVNSFGQYSLTVTNSLSGCEQYDTIIVIKREQAKPQLLAEKVICEGNSYVANPQVSQDWNFLWSTGAMSPTINLSDSGLYWVRIWNDDGYCPEVEDSIVIHEVIEPFVELGEDQVLCQGEELQMIDLVGEMAFTEYNWGNGDVGADIPVYNTGFYRITVSNACGKVSDEVYVEFQDCFSIYVPNAFTPDGDGLNDVFIPEFHQEFTLYIFEVYDRWGNRVFYTESPKEGWDGTYNGVKNMDGMYAWRIKYASAWEERPKRRTMVGEVFLTQ